MDGLIGRTFGQYRIIERIGVGGMATIYKAYQPSLDRYVALKVLSPTHAEQPGFNERFQREARAVANINHPNILPVFDFGQESDYGFIAMRYVEGARTLKEVMETSLSLAQVVDLIGQIAAALDHAHRHGVVHRDIKPSNVLMDGNWALLTDFGIAKMTEASVQLTGTGVGIGTPAYMSPEQGQGLPVDHRTDIYSLGVILFEMLTGHIPHDAETPFGIVIKRISEPLPLPRSINPDIPEPVERVILKTLATDPADRFETAAGMAQSLSEAAEPLPELPPLEPDLPIVPAPPSIPEQAHPATTIERPVAPGRPGMPVWAWGALGVVVLLVAVGLWTLLRDGEPEPVAVVARVTQQPSATATAAPLDPDTVSPTVVSQSPTVAATVTAPLPPPSATSGAAAPSPAPTETPAATATLAPPTETPEPTATPPPPTAVPTDTALPPPPPTATATAAPQPVVAFRPLPLGAAANAASDFLSPPVGATALGGVPFELSGSEFKSQASPSPNNGYPSNLVLPADVPRAYRVHVLVTAGNGFNQFNGNVVGRVVAYCDGVAIPVTDLQLGRELREWHMADNVVSSASRPRQVWSGAIRAFPNLSGHYDMLSLDLPGACQSGRLTALELVDSSASTVNSLDPGLNLVGVSVEHYQ